MMRRYGCAALAAAVALCAGCGKPKKKVVEPETKPAVAKPATAAR